LGAFLKLKQLFFFYRVYIAFQIDCLLIMQIYILSVQEN